MFSKERSAACQDENRTSDRTASLGQKIPKKQWFKIGYLQSVETIISDRAAACIKHTQESIIFK